jgi:Zn ribbon nucleic-acid-binding protein
MKLVRTIRNFGKRLLRRIAFYRKILPGTILPPDETKPITEAGGVFCCDDCSALFPAPSTSGFDYATHILFSKSGCYAAKLYAACDPLCDNLLAQLKSDSQWSNWPEDYQDEILYGLFEITCDPCPDGSHYRFQLGAKCPSCGSRDTYFSEKHNLVNQVKPIKINLITHEKWNSLSEKEKEEKIKTCLDKK